MKKEVNIYSFYEDNYVSLEDYKTLIKKLEEEKNINDKLSSALESSEIKIDKAIEYIKKYSFLYEHITGDYKAVESEEILKILKGE